jgi:hypothetical protein
LREKLVSEEAGIYNPSLLAWEDLEDDARNLFHVWVTGSELQWARRAWRILENQKLTAYDTALGLTRVQVRLLTMAVLYWDFCLLAHEEFWEETDLWLRATEDAGLSAFRVAQIVEKQFEEREFDSSESDLLQCALIKLTERERPVVARALIKGFGSEMKLLQAMEASTNCADADDPDNVEDETRFDPDRAALTLVWIMSGMHRL